MFWRGPRVVGVLPLPPWFSAWCVPDAATATQDLALRMTASVTDGDVRHAGMVAQMSFAGPHVLTGRGVRHVPLPAHHASARRRPPGPRPGGALRHEQRALAVHTDPALEAARAEARAERGPVAVEGMLDRDLHSGRRQEKAVLAAEVARDQVG